MALYWTFENGGAINSDHWSEALPADAVEITEDERIALVDAANSGKKIARGVNGRPEIREADPPTTQQIIDRLESVVQRHLDATVKRDRGYDNIYTACTYADEPAVPKFQAEGLAARKWRSLVWLYSNQVKNDVIAGMRQIPTAEQLIAELPQIVWPS